VRCGGFQYLNHPDAPFLCDKTLPKPVHGEKVGWLVGVTKVTLIWHAICLNRFAVLHFMEKHMQQPVPKAARLGTHFCDSLPKECHEISHRHHQTL
jgi:hypothetical protein